VDTPGPGGGFSAPQTFTVDNPAPTLTSLSQTSVTIGSAATTITLTGTGFINGSTAEFNSKAIATTFVNATTLTAVIPADDLVEVGAAKIVVVNPTPGGGISSALTFTVAPSLATVVVETDGALVEFVPGMSLPEVLSQAGTVTAASAVLDGSGQNHRVRHHHGHRGVLSTTRPCGNTTLPPAGHNSPVGFSSRSAPLQMRPATPSYSALSAPGALYEQSNTNVLNAGFTLLSQAGSVLDMSAVTTSSGDDTVYVITTGPHGPPSTPTLSGDIPPRQAGFSFRPAPSSR